jgi:hypothetical protein
MTFVQVITLFYYFTQITNDVADRIEKALDGPGKPGKKYDITLLEINYMTL